MAVEQEAFGDDQSFEPTTLLGFDIQAMARELLGEESGPVTDRDLTIAKLLGGGWRPPKEAAVDPAIERLNPPERRVLGVSPGRPEEGLDLEGLDPESAIVGFRALYRQVSSKFNLDNRKKPAPEIQDGLTIVGFDYRFYTWVEAPSDRALTIISQSTDHNFGPPAGFSRAFRVYHSELQMSESGLVLPRSVEAVLHPDGNFFIRGQVPDFSKGYSRNISPFNSINPTPGGLSPQHLDNIKFLAGVIDRYQPPRYT